MTTLRSAGCGSRSCSRGGRRVSGSNGALPSREEVAARDPRERALRASPRTSVRTATRSARWRRCSRCWPRSARTRWRSCPRTSSRSRTSTASSSSRASRPSRPPDLCSRTLIFLDCGNIDRTPVEQLRRDDGTALIVNIDHHHDNTRFGTINHVDPQSSCTAEMVWDLMHGLGVESRSRSPRRSTSAW